MKGPFQKLTQSYRDMKLQSKFTLALVLAVTVPVLLLGLFFYGRLYDMVVADTIRQEQDASAKTAPLIEEMIQQVVDVSGDISSQDFYQTLFHAPITGEPKDLAASEEAADFHGAVSRLRKQEPVTSIRIYMDLPPEAAAFFTDDNTRDIFSPIWPIQGTYWYGILQGRPTLSELYCPSFYLGPREREENGDLAYIHTTTVYYQQKAYPVYIVVYYSDDALRAILKENLSSPENVSYILNDRDNLVATSDTSLSSLYWLGYSVVEDAFMSSNNFMERTILGETVYAGFYSIADTGWYMVTVLPSTPLIEQSNQIMIRFVLFYTAFLILAVLLANVLSRSVTNRISSVIRQMNLIKGGTPTPMESPSAHDEVGDLIDTYNYMTRKMQALMDEQAKSAEDLRIAEFNSLQAQINPHFLYNTMDMINWMARQGRTQDVSDAAQRLSRFYKLTLSRRETISTIGQEIEHVTIYAQIQNMRFHDSIEFITDIPDDLNHYPIPKLTLQPVVENAILHGILEKESKSGTILLTGWREDGDIVLLISDDGVGIGPETLSVILQGDGQSASGGTNIAVYNTHRRLQILYGPSYGLSYSSQPGKGTEVEIRIPAMDPS